MSVRTGGPAVYVAGLARALAGLGIETTIFTTDLATPASTAEARSGIQPSDLPHGWEDVDIRFFPVRRPYRLAYSPALRTALRSHIKDFDVVHIHSLFLYPQYAAFREAYAAGLPYVITPHGALDPYLRRRGRLRKAIVDRIWQRRMLNEAALIHLTADEESSQLDDLKLAATRRVVTNGFELSRFLDASGGETFRRQYGIGGSTPVVLYHGRLAEKKGLDVLITAFAAVQQTHDDAVLVIVGPDDDNLADQFRAIANECGIANSVLFTGMLLGDELLAALSAGTVWVLPSHAENFGYAVIEAMAAGLPVVTTPHVNIASQIEAANAGVVCSLDAGIIAQAVNRLLDDVGLRSQLSENGRRLAALYDWSVVGPQLAQMYSDADSSSRMAGSGAPVSTTPRSLRGSPE
jgi:glycosyltransferase involved in cell wall biosynthesis